MLLAPAIDDRGIIVTFKQLLTVLSNPAAQDQLLPVMWTQQFTSGPRPLSGARCRQGTAGTGRMAAPSSGVKVPDLFSRQFADEVVCLWPNKGAVYRASCVAARVNIHLGAQAIVLGRTAPFVRATNRLLICKLPRERVWNLDSTAGRRPFGQCPVP